MNNYVIIHPEINKIEFKDKRAYECADAPGEYVPSNTTILDCAPKGKMFYEYLKNRGKEADSIMMEAMEKGSRIHSASEDYDNGRLEIVPENFVEEEIEMIHRYKEFSDRYILKKPIAIEWGAGSKLLGFGGCLDRIIEFEGKNYLLDIKTGMIYDYYWRQLAAYKKLWEQFNPQIKIHQYGIIHLKSATRSVKEWQGQGWKVEFPEEPDELYWSLFQNTKIEFHRLYPNWKPKNRIFDLILEKTYPDFIKS